MSEEVIENNDVNETEKNATESVDVKAYESIKNDMHKFKRQYQDLSSEKEELLSKLNQLEEEKLKNSSNYKELWQKEKESKSQLQEKLKQISNSLVEEKKREAILREAKKHNFDDDFSDLIEAFDTSSVLVETTDSGNIIINGADTWVEQLRADRPKLFKVKSDPALNNSTGGFDGKEKTYSTSEILKLQKENPEKYQDIIKNKRHLIVRK